MPPVFRVLVGVCLAVAVLAGAPSAAQESARETAAAPDVLILPLNKARVFELSRDARDVLVSNPEIADVVIKTPRTVYVLGLSVGDTNVFFFDAEGKVILRLEIRVELDLTGLRNVLAEIMPDERIEVTAVNENIVLRGTARSARVAEDARQIARRFVDDDSGIVNMIGILSGQQVLLKVRIAEVERAILKDIGFDLTASRQVSDVIIALITGGRLPENIALPILRDTTAFATGFVNVVGSEFLFTAVLDALERQNLAKTLAEPTLTAVSGENANLLVGGEFPVPVNVTVDDAGRIIVGIEFKQFGVVMSFTPVVLDSGLISLKLSVEVSNISTSVEAGAIEISGVAIPATLANRAETTVELPSGGSLVIAGLLQDDITTTVEGFPGLKDIPILGALFRSERFQKNETELIIAVTPYVVSPVTEEAIALPTDGFAPSSDFDLYLLGRLHGVYAKSEVQQPGRLMGPIGYILE